MIKYYLGLLKDIQRIETFREAISKSVRSGDVVLDLGSGTGYLSFLALQAGASKVYGIEYHQNLVEEAEQKAKELKLKNKVYFVHCYSLHLDRSAIKQVDIILSETLGFMGVGEGIVKYISDARRKWLKQNGKIIPQKIELYLIPILHPYSDGRKMKQAMIEVRPEYFRGEVVKIGEYDLLKDVEVKIDKEFTFVLRGEKINGFGGWFRAQLSPNVTLDTSPFSSQTCWNQMFYPIGEYKGDKIKIRIISENNNDLVSLKIEKI